jgi:phosphate transport system substrate-binding protein
MIIACIAILCAVMGYEYYIEQTELQGTINISGAFALYPMMVVWAGEFHKMHPKVVINVAAGGAGKGMSDALAGLVDLGMVSRNITQAEVNEGAYYVAVVKGAAVVTVSKDNPVLSDLLTRGVTRQILYNIYIAGNVTTWGQVVSRPSVTNKIDVYTRSDAAGVADALAGYLGGKKQADLIGIGVLGDPGLLEAVKEDRLGIGYNNIGYAYDNATKQQVDGIRVVPIDLNGNGKIDPQEDFYSNVTTIDNAIASGVYPTPPAMDLYLVTKQKFTGITQDFVKWILTDGQKYVEANGYVPYPTNVINEQLIKLQ